MEHQASLSCPEEQEALLPVYWVYILLCENQTYYTGYTNNLTRRYAEHVAGSGKCKYTRSFKPLKIAQCWTVKGSKSMAMQLERQIKKLSRAQKERVIAYPQTLSTDVRVEPCLNSKHCTRALR